MNGLEVVLRDLQPELMGIIVLVGICLLREPLFALLPRLSSLELFGKTKAQFEPVLKSLASDSSTTASQVAEVTALVAKIERVHRDMSVANVVDAVHSEEQIASPGQIPDRNEVQRVVRSILDLAATSPNVAIVRIVYELGQSFISLLVALDDPLAFDTPPGSGAIARLERYNEEPFGLIAQTCRSFINDTEQFLAIPVVEIPEYRTAQTRVIRDGVTLLSLNYSVARTAANHPEWLDRTDHPAK